MAIRTFESVVEAKWLAHAAGVVETQGFPVVSAAPAVGASSAAAQVSAGAGQEAPAPVVHTAGALRRPGSLYVRSGRDALQPEDDMMAVMNFGKFVEFGPSESIYAHPKEAYTERLIEAIPRDNLEQIERRQAQRRAAQGEE